jgi:hypothetical protein
MALSMQIDFTDAQEAVINKEAKNQSMTPEELTKLYLDSWVSSLERAQSRALAQASRAAFDALPEEKQAEVLRLLGIEL